MGEARPHVGTIPWLVDWRAARTRDPVERLRYLRAAGAAAEGTVQPPANDRRSLPAGRAGMVACVFLLLLTTVGRIASPGIPKVANRHAGQALRPSAPAQAMAGPVASVWLVERSDEYDVYSNGLRIDSKYMVANRPRRYRVVDRNAGPAPVAIERADPAGIVYHTTESHLAPFSESQSAALRRAGMSLVEYVRHHRAYHFVIDRFGRVFGVVQETDVADHAGHSVWADERSIYLGLNASFLGVAFEARTPEVNPAQIHSARILTEMLRAKYRIAASNCVTHAQVSVNPANRRMGYHTDWAAGFPFAQLGLPDNYRQKPASLALFGFAYDDYLVSAAGGEAWAGLAVGQRELEQQARVAGMPLARYRATLQQRYREALAAIERPSTP
jgi:hypothetical protein